MTHEPRTSSNINKVFNQVNEITAALFRGKNINDDKLFRLLKFFQIQAPGGFGGAIDRKEMLKAEFMKHANELITKKLY